jgi:hypothetical protein
MKKYLLLLICFFSLKLSAQESPEDSTRSPWTFSAWAEQFIIPNEEDFFNPTFYARHKTLHLEARYNYEDRNTTSLWAGKRFEFGKMVEFVFVPMGGIVFGNTIGVAPGLEMELRFKKFDFYSESEYLFNFETKESNFFYMYSELAMRPVRPIRTGIIAQRTKLFESEKEIQRGIFAEYYFRKYRAGVFCYSPFNRDNNFWIASFSVDF